MPVVQHQVNTAAGIGAGPLTVFVRRVPDSFSVDGESEATFAAIVTTGPDATHPDWPTGYVEVTLQGEGNWQGQGYYLWSYLESGRTVSHAFQVPDTGGPYQLSDLVIAASPVDAYLPVRLSELRDTQQLALATDGQIPAWNATDQRWEPVTGGSGGGGGEVPATRQIIAGTGLTGGGTLQADRTLTVAYGTSAGTAAQGNDSRLSDGRTPTGAAGGSLTGTYPSPTIAAGVVGGTEIAAVVKDPAAGTAGLRTLGTGATQAAAGNDSRLSDARTPTAHATTHGSAGSDPVTPAAIGAATTSHTHAQADVTGLVAALAALQPLDADLTAVAGLTPANDDLLQRKAGTWTNRTPAQVKADLALAIGDVTGLQTALDALPRLATTTQSGSYTLALADAGTAVETTSATGVNITVPPNSSVAFPVGTVVELLQYGAGQITVVAGAGVTIRTASSLTSRAQYSLLSLRKRATDEWVLSGDST